MGDGKKKTKKKMLGKEFLDNQKKQNELFKESKRKRPAKVKPPSNRAAVQAEVKRQEAALAAVLEEIKLNKEDIEEKKEKMALVSNKINEHVQDKESVALGKPILSILHPKDLEDTLEWAFEIASQPNDILEKELLSILTNVKKYMIMFNGVKTGLLCTPQSNKSYHTQNRSGADKSISSKDSNILHMLEDLEDPNDKDNLTLTEKLAKQEARGYAHFVNSISPPTPSSRMRHSMRKSAFFNARRRLKQRPTFVGTIKEVMASDAFKKRKEKPPQSPSAPLHSRRPTSASPRTRSAVNKQNPSTLSPSRPQSASTGDSGRPRSSIYKAMAPAMVGIKFAQASRQLLESKKAEEKEKPAAQVPLVFNSSAKTTAKTRTMSVLSVQVNAAGEEEEVMMSKLLRVEDGNPQHGRKRSVGSLSSASAGSLDTDQSCEESIPQPEELVDRPEESEEEEGQLRVLKRYCNLPEMKWNSEDLYSHNEMFDTSEFHEASKRKYEKMYEYREAVQRENKKIFAELNEASRNCTKKLIRRFTAQHKLQDRTIDHLLQMIATRDYFRPEVVGKLRKAIAEKVEAGSTHKHILDELRDINSLVMYSIHTSRMRNLARNDWFLRLLASVLEYKKKVKTPVPISLVKFLVVSSKLLENDFKIDKSLFYDLVGRLIGHDDHKDVIVHRSLTVFREDIGIGVEEFAEYLEKRNIHQCTELLVELRQVQDKKSRLRRLQSMTSKGEETSSTCNEPPEEVALPTSKRSSESAPTSLFSSSVEFSSSERPTTSYALSASGAAS